MPTYRVNLEDGRKFDLESDREPTSQEAYSALLDGGHVERPKEDDLGLAAGIREGLKSYPSLEAGGIAAAAAQPAIAPIAAATGPFAPITEAVLSGGVALAGTISARWAQDKALDAVIPKDAPILNQLRSDQTKQDVTEHPVSTMVGSLLSGGTPNLYNLARTGKTVAGLLDGEGSTLLKKAYTATKSETLTRAFINEARNATDLKARQAAVDGIKATLQVGVNSGIFGGQALIEGRPINEVLTEAAIGAAFTGHGPGHLLKEILSSKPQSTEPNPTGKIIDVDDKDLSPQSVIAPIDTTLDQQSTQTKPVAPQAPSAVSTLPGDSPASPLNDIGNESQIEGVPAEVSPETPPIDSERKESSQSTEALDDLNKQLLSLGSVNSGEKDKYFNYDRNPSSEERKKIASQGDRVKAAAYRDANGIWHSGWSFEDAMTKGGVSKESIIENKDKLTKDLGFIVESSDGSLRIANRKEAKVVAHEAGQLHHDLYLPSKSIFRNLKESHLYDAMEGLGEDQETPKIGPDESKAEVVNKKASEQIDSVVIDPGLSPIAIEAAKSKLDSQLTENEKNYKLKENAGWKLHLATENSEDVSKFLKEKGLKHKVGRSGGQEGKDITVYIGDKNSANKHAKEIQDSIGHLLKDPYGDTLKDDIPFSEKVMGRFDANGDNEFHQYGSGGVPYLTEDVKGPWEGSSSNSKDKEERSKAKLEKKYGEFYTGKYQPKETTETEPEPFGIPGSTVAKDSTPESQSEEDLALAKGKKPLSQDAKIIGATYTDPSSGRVYVGSNHLDAMGKSGADTKNFQTRASREKPQFGFKILHPDGTSEVIGRREAGRLAVENKQIKPDAKVPKHGKMHSDHVNFHDVSPETLDTLSLAEAGFESKEDFDKAFDKESRKEVNETQEEFLQRIYCK